MNLTPNYGLKKPLEEEGYSINDFNTNADLIDSALARIELKNKEQDNLSAGKKDLNAEISRATAKENEIDGKLEDEIARAKSTENDILNGIREETNRAIDAEAIIQDALDLKANIKSPVLTGIPQAPTAPAGTNTLQLATTAFAQTAVSNHNVSTSAHNDIRNLILGLTTRLNALADSDDATLDQLSEIVAYIKSNRSLIENVTTNKVNVADIVDNLTSSAANKPLAAKQGKVLNDLITALTAAVGNKVDKVSGKGLSTNDYTTAEKNKLSGIAAGAEVNVQADWNVTDSGSDAFIKNKPAIPSVGNGTLTIQRNGTNIQTFTANQNTNTIVNITVPTKTSELTNDSGFKTTDNDTTYPYYSKSIDASFATKFRTETKGNTSGGNYISNVRTEAAGVANAPQYGAGLAWGIADTHGYLNIHYSNATAYIGGGNADKLNWIKQLAFMDSNVASATKATQDGNGSNIADTYLKRSGGTMLGDLTVPKLNVEATGEAQVNVSRQGYSGRLVVSGGNKFGLYDSTHGKWIIYSDSDGSIEMFGKADKAVQDENGNNIANTYVKKTGGDVSACNGGITYSDSQPTALTVGMTWIGN